MALLLVAQFAWPSAPTVAQDATPGETQTEQPSPTPTDVPPEPTTPPTEVPTLTPTATEYPPTETPTLTEEPTRTPAEPTRTPRTKRSRTSIPTETPTEETDSARGAAVEAVVAADATRLTFAAEADAHVLAGSPNANVGAATALVTDSDPMSEVYLRFAVTGGVGPVQQATLRLWVTNATTNGPAVFLAANGWAETGITWNTKPGRTGTGVADKGAIASGWIEFNVTPLITGNGTFTLSLPPQSTDGLTVASREAAAANRPQLVVVFATGGGATVTPRPNPTATRTNTPTATPTRTPTSAAAMTLLPVADSYVRADTAASNFGSASILKSDGSPVSVTYLKFDLGALAGRTVTSAKLRMKVSNASTSTQAVRSVTNTTWTESGITFANRPAVGATIRTFPGGAAGAVVEVDVSPGFVGQTAKLVTLAIDSSGSDGFDVASRSNPTDPIVLVVQTTGTPSSSPTPTSAPGSGAIAGKGVSWRQPAQYWAGRPDGIESDLDDMVAANITWARLDLFYSEVPDPTFDTIVQKAQEHGIRLIVIVHKPWPNKDLGTDGDRAFFRSWLAQMVSRYSYHVKHWEIGNEPNLRYEWNIDDSSGSDQSAYEASVGRYVLHLKDGFETVKATDPSATVLFGGLSEWTVERYMDALIKTDAHRYFDVMSFHPYGYNPDRVVSRFSSFKAKMALDANYAVKPIWVTESGFNTSWSNKAGFVNSEQTKADYLTRAMRLLHSAGAALPIFWYTLHENEDATGYGLTGKNPANLATQFYPAYAAFRDLTF